MIDHKRIEFLTECAELDGTEWGEAMTCLVALYRNAHGVLGDELTAAMESELLLQIEWAEEHCTIVNRVETHEIHFKELEVDLD